MEVAVPIDTDDLVPPDCPRDVRGRAADPPREPCTDPTLGIPVEPVTTSRLPKHRVVAIGDSLAHGFQSGAVFNTDLSFPAIVAYELGWMEQFRYPRYAGGPGGLPFNIEYLLRDLENRFGAETSGFDPPFALFRSRQFLDGLEDYWERGPGSVVPVLAGYMHALAIYGWDLRDALSKSAATCRAVINTPRDNFLDQVIENNTERAALRVYPSSPVSSGSMTLFDVAAALGDDHDDGQDVGIETLIVELGANNALASVIKLDLVWSGAQYAEVAKKGAYTVWTPKHFASELLAVVDQVKRIKARHVIWCTVPHVTIPPVSRGIGTKVTQGSRYFPYYARPWMDDAHFDADRDQCLRAPEARAIDTAIDIYNDAIQHEVELARSGADGTIRNWYLLDLAGVLDRLAARRYITDPNARPSWWTPYPLPPLVASLNPVPDSRFLTSDRKGGRATGGLFSLDGVHPTTVGYGLIAQEVINIMQRAGVTFANGHTVRSNPGVDFERLIRLDTLITRPPQNIDSTLKIIEWADTTLEMIKRALQFKS
jgi:hypothetical protein